MLGQRVRRRFGNVGCSRNGYYLFGGITPFGDRETRRVPIIPNPHLDIAISKPRNTKTDILIDSLHHVYVQPLSASTAARVYIPPNFPATMLLGRTDAVIVSLARTPIGKFGGTMSAVSGPRLGAIAVREAVARSGLSSTRAGVGCDPRAKRCIVAGTTYSRYVLLYRPC